MKAEEKEKALELYNKFRMHDIQICDLLGDELVGYEEMHYKNCALICIQYLQDNGNLLDINYNKYEEFKEEIKNFKQ